MIFEQTLINPNFVGKEAFRWFLAITSGESDQYSNYGTRAKIRILGYHGEEVAEKDLPWAHVLVPLTMGGGSRGSMAQGHIKASTLVVGFFADGNDAQQPIVIGAFYNGAQTEFPAKFSDGTKYLRLFKDSKEPINPYNIPVKTETKTRKTSTGSNSSTQKTNGVVTPKGEASNSNGELKQSAATASLNEDNATVSRPGHCVDSKKGFNKVLNALKEFIKVLNTVNQVATGYINPVLNKISNIDQEIQTIGVLITDWISTQIKWVRDQIVLAIYRQLKFWLGQITLPPWAEKLKKIAIGELADGIYCAIGKILKNILDYITNFLFGLIGNIVSFPLCAAEAFLGSAIQTITNELADAIGPLTDQISSIIGPIGTVTSYVNQALGYARGALNFLLCDDNVCKDYFDYEMNKGHINTVDISNFQKTLNSYSSQTVSNFLDENSAQKWLGNFGGGEGLPPELAGAAALFPDCNIFSFECGPPTVSIFGGGGSGASGNAVVDAVGGILGVNITNPGSGYSSPPYIRFEDPCENGRGAYGVATIDSNTTGVSGVTMYYPGSGYLGPSTATDPCKVTPFDETGSPVTGSISRVVIDRTGIGYSSSDRIYDAACTNDVELYPIVDDFGRIIDVNIVNPGTSVNITPDLQINSDNGFGAVLIPSLTFRPLSGITTETDPQKIKSVVYCTEDHGR